MRRRICKENMGCAGRKTGKEILLLAFVLCLLGTEQARGDQGQQDKLVMTRQLNDAEREEFSEPPGTWTDEQGKEYRLSGWSIEEVPGKRTRESAERRIRYEGVEGAETLPESILVYDEETGEQEMGKLPLKEKSILREWWDASFQVPVTFHAYGAQEYTLGGITVNGAEAARTDLWGPELLRMLGLSPEYYRILTLEWTGDVYADPSGQACRQALARGEKLLRDYEAVYAGELEWQEPAVYELRMEYEPVKETMVSVKPSDSAEEEAAGPDEKADPLWYWVHSGFVLTVAAGLLGIAVGAAVLGTTWLKQRKKERDAGRLPMLDK